MTLFTKGFAIDLIFFLPSAREDERARERRSERRKEMD
jgi:hypothetical protein